MQLAKIVIKCSYGYLSYTHLGWAGEIPYQAKSSCSFFFFRIHEARKKLLLAYSLEESDLITFV